MSRISKDGLVCRLRFTRKICRVKLILKKRGMLLANNLIVCFTTSFKITAGITDIWHAVRVSDWNCSHCRLLIFKSINYPIASGKKSNFRVNPLFLVFEIIKYSFLMIDWFFSFNYYFLFGTV